MVKRVLIMATSLQARAMLTLAYGCGLRAGDIDSEQMIIGVVQSKGLKDRHVMLPVYDLLMKASAETTLAIAADPKRLSARIGVTAVLHTWGSARAYDRAGWRALAR